MGGGDLAGVHRGEGAELVGRRLARLVMAGDGLDDPRRQPPQLKQVAADLRVRRAEHLALHAGQIGGRVGGVLDDRRVVARAGLGDDQPPDVVHQPGDQRVFDRLLVDRRVARRLLLRDDVARQHADGQAVVDQLVQRDAAQVLPLELPKDAGRQHQRLHHPEAEQRDGVRHVRHPHRQAEERRVD